MSGWAAPEAAAGPSHWTAKWLGLVAPLGVSYGIGLIALLAAGGAAMRAVRTPGGVRDAGSLRRVLPTRINDLGAYELAPVFSPAEWEAVRAGGVAMEVYRQRTKLVSRDGIRSRVTLAQVSTGFVRMVGAPIVRGRSLSARDARSAVLVSERLAIELFGQEAAAVGAVVHVDGRPTTVAGVLGRDFLGVDQDPVDAWEVMGPSERRDVQDYSLSGLVRLEAGSSSGAVADRTAALLAASGARVRSVRLAPVTDDRLGGPGLARRVLPFVLLLCAAVAALALANCWLLVDGWGLVRTADLRIRYMVGASPWRLARGAAGVPLATLAATTVVVAVLLGKSDLALAWIGIDAGRGPTPAVDQAMGAGFAFGVATIALGALAWRIVARVTAVRRDAGRQQSRARALVVATYLGTVTALAVATVPVAAANLAAAHTKPGFAPENALVITAVFDSGPRARDLDLIRAGVSAAQQVPFVAAVAASSSAPFRAVSTGTVARGAGNFEPAAAHLYHFVGDVTGALGVEKRAGVSGAPLRPTGEVSVTEALASRWGWGASPGQCVYVDGDVCEALGLVVADMNSIALGEAPFPTVFAPMRRAPASGRVYFLVRTSHRATGAEVGRLESTLLTALTRASVRAERMTDVVREQTAPLRAGQSICAVLLGLSVVLATLGIRASTSLSVATRRRELGIRAALGASRGALVATVLRENVVWGAGAAVMGIALGMMATRVLQAVLVHADQKHALMQMGVGLAMPALVVGVATAGAFRAARLEPAALI